MRTPKNQTNLSTFGGTEIQSSVISHTSLTDLVVVVRVLDGDWTIVRQLTLSTLYTTCSLRSSCHQRENVREGQDVRNQERDLWGLGPLPNRFGV